MEDIIKNLNEFMKSQQQAEKEGQHEFTCPLCGATARWDRSTYNNHLHCHCFGCGFGMME